MNQKYRNVRTEFNGITYDSKKEANRAAELRILELGQKINDLKKQVRFALWVNRFLICTYVADFVYTENGKQIVEDVKSPATRKLPVYRLKKKLMRACLGIEIVEV